MTPPEISVLVTAYNRPEHLKRCLEALARSGASRVLLSVDGPGPGQERRVRETVEVAESELVAFEQADLRVSSHHRGCAQGVIRAIDWAFECSPAVVIVEDDIQVSAEFIDFSHLSLARFSPDDRVGSIGGMSLVPMTVLEQPVAPMRASLIPTSWGWATWSDRWEVFRRYSGTDLHVPAALDGFFRRYFWRGILKDVDAGRIDSWAYPWLRVHWLREWWAVLPSQALVLNRGFDSYSTHTTGAAPPYLPRRLNAPSGFIATCVAQGDIELDAGADQWMRDNVLNADPPHLWYSRFRRRLRTLP